MRNKAIRRSLAWMLTVATLVGAVPVSAEEMVSDTTIVAEENEILAEDPSAEEELPAEDINENVAANSLSIEAIEEINEVETSDSVQTISGTEQRKSCSRS